MSERKKYRKINEELEILESFAFAHKEKKINFESHSENENLICNVSSINTNACSSDNIEIDKQSQCERDSDIDLNLSVSESEFSNSNHEVDDELVINLENDLTEWIVKYKIKNESANALLTILRKFHPTLPKDSRTLRKTSNKISDIISMGFGSYVHFGLKNYLKQYIQKPENKQTTAVAIDIGIDGIPLSKSSSSQLWPILGNVVGNKEVFVIGAYHGYTKPFCSNAFLEQFVSEMENITSEGFVFNEKKIYVEIRAIVCDAPAKSMVLGVKGHTGYYGCTKCEVKGEYLNRRMAYLEINSPLRDDEKFSNRNQLMYHKLLDPIALERINIGCVSQIPVDYMHCVLLGVTRQTIKAWTKNKKTPYSLTKDDLSTIDKRTKMVKIGIIKEFSRKPRNFSEIDRWKATELRLFLCYTGPVILKYILPTEYYDHFMLLACSIRILCDSEECINNNFCASEMLRKYVTDFSTLYEPCFVGYNVHNLIHLAADVSKFGNLDEYSAFKFENHLQHLKKNIKKHNQPLQQLRNRLIEIETHLRVDHNDEPIPYATVKVNLGGCLYQDLFFMKCKYSVRAPNNYCFIDEKIFVIKQILQKNLEIIITGNFIENIEEYFNKPFSSRNLNILCSHNELLDPEMKSFNISAIKFKIMALKTESLTVYLPLL